MVIRPDQELSVTFTRSGGVWGHFTVTWAEEMTDGTRTWTKARFETYDINDLDANTKAALLSAWAGMKALRDSVDPIE